MLQVTGLAAERGGQPLFSDIHFSLQAGDLLHVAGANGTGKTTLLRSLCGLTLPTAGEIRWQGEAVSSHSDSFYASLLYIGHRNGLYGDLSVKENLHLTATQANGEEQLAPALKALGIARHADRPLRHLSQGQQRRAALARLLLEDRQLWVLDEPLSALDTNAIDWVVSCLERHLDKGGMAILTTHQDAAIISRVTCNVVLVA